MTQDATPSASNVPVTWQPATPWVPAPATPPFVDRLPDRLAARAVVAIVAAGLLAQLLFVRQASGINFLIWIAVVIGAAFALRRSTVRLDRADIWLPVAALTFAAFIALRDDASLFGFDLLASCALTLASVVAIGGLPVSRSAWNRIVSLGGSALLVFWSGAAHMAHGVAPLLSALPTIGGGSSARRVVRGLLIALPLVLGFVLLFAAADAVFQNVVRQVFDVRLDSTELVGRSVFAFIAAWLFAGTMAVAWLSHDRFAPDQPAIAAGARTRNGRRPLSAVEGVTVLVVLDALFALFVIIQAAYLFPGNDPLTASGMTYAEYARRGFFELIVVGVMAGLVILVLDALIDHRTLPYQLGAAVLTVLTGVVLISATVRLGIYQQAYGWTELRFYALAAIGLLALGLLATLAGSLFAKVHVVPKFMVGAGLAIALLCNAIGPQSFVTTQNLQRATGPTLVPADGYSGLDTGYLAELGADAVPILLAARDRLPADEYDRVTALLRSAAFSLREQERSQGWQSWNLSRQSALDALAAAGF